MGCCQSRDKPKDELSLSIEEQLAQLKANRPVPQRKSIRQMSCSFQECGSSISVANKENNTTSRSSIYSLDSHAVEESKEDSLAEAIIQAISKHNREPYDTEKMYDDSSLKTYLQIYMHTDPQTNLNITRCEWLVPCRPGTFISFMNDIDTQSTLDTKIDQFKTFESNPIEHEYKLYLAYKGFLLVSSRDFVYFKKIKQIDPQLNIWCDASQSIVDPLYPEDDNKIRCRIILSGHTIQPLTHVLKTDGFLSRFNTVSNPEKYSVVRLYSHCDTKLNVPLSLTRSQTVGEMKTYIEKCFRRLEQIEIQ